MFDLYVDGDACPVKDEVYRVARRHDCKVFVVSHGRIRVPGDQRVEAIRVKPGLDAADDWIAEHVGEGDIAITTDIPLAQRCLAKGAQVLTPNGREFTEDSIGNAIATRELMEHLRQMGETTPGPAAFTTGDRSKFLSRLHDLVAAFDRKKQGR